MLIKTLYEYVCALGAFVRPYASSMHTRQTHVRFRDVTGDMTLTPTHVFLLLRYVPDSSQKNNRTQLNGGAPI